MGSGKHSSNRRDKKNSFDDTSYSTSRSSFESDDSRYINENNYSNETENNYTNEEENSYDSKVNDSYEKDVSFAESNFWDEEEREINYKKIAIIIAIIVVAIIGGVLVYKFVINKPEKEPDKPAVQEPTTMIETLEGYKVLGKIKIPDLNIEQYILDSTASKALQNGVGVIDNGASINNYGNFCLAGHNSEKIFKDLDKLKVGDEFVLIDRHMEETKYQVTEILEVEPDNLECLLQDETKVEVTLITCKDGATQRLVVKAQEKGTVSTTSNTNTSTNTVGTNTVSTDGEKDV